MVVRHHYEERRRRILASLDREITAEKKSLTEAREEAIHRLEAFVQRYSGDNADDVATPDAMFRPGDVMSRNCVPSPTSTI